MPMGETMKEGGLVHLVLLRLLEGLGLTLQLVQTEYNGTRHYKDERKNRLVLYPDGSYEVVKP